MTAVREQYWLTKTIIYNCIKILIYRILVKPVKPVKPWFNLDSFLRVLATMPDY
jgi:hypothetical protein